MRLFDNTSKDTDCLKIYLQQLLNKRMTKKSFANLEMEISALNHIIHVNGVDYVDPRSAVKTLDSTIKKTIDMYRVSLSSDSNAVHRAVSQGIIHILESWIKPKYGLDLNKIEELFITPMENLMSSGDDKIAQIGASHVYYFLTRAAFERKYTKLVNYLYEKFLHIFTVSLS